MITFRMGSTETLSTFRQDANLSLGFWMGHRVRAARIFLGNADMCIMKASFG